MEGLLVLGRLKDDAVCLWVDAPAVKLKSGGTEDGCLEAQLADGQFW